MRQSFRVTIVSLRACRHKRSLVFYALNFVLYLCVCAGASCARPRTRICSATFASNTRGVGVTCYSHNGKDLYCNKPAKGTCWTTGGWCPPDFGGDDEVLPDVGVRPSPIPVLFMLCLSVFPSLRVVIFVAKGLKQAAVKTPLHFFSNI